MSWSVWATGLGMAVGGVLWGVHGAFTMLKPGGEEVQFSDTRGYSLVVDTTSFVSYNAPGAAALLLTALALLSLCYGLPSRSTRTATLGRITVMIAVALGVVSAAGVVALFDPAFTAGRVAGAFFLGLGALLLARGTTAANGRLPSTGWLTATGALGLGLLPLWPLVYAVQMVPEWGGVVYFGVFSIAWVIGGAGRLRTPASRLTDSSST